MTEAAGRDPAPCPAGSARSLAHRKVLADLGSPMLDQALAARLVPGIETCSGAGPASCAGTSTCSNGCCASTCRAGAGAARKGARACGSGLERFGPPEPYRLTPIV